MRTVCYNAAAGGEIKKKDKESKVMKRYRCKKTFCVDNYDEDGYLIENSSTIIEEGKVYELDESGCMMIGGKNHVHLDAVDGNSWIEITKDHLEEYFGRLKADNERCETNLL